MCFYKSQSQRFVTSLESVAVLGVIFHSIYPSCYAVIASSIIRDYLVINFFLFATDKVWHLLGFFSQMRYHDHLSGITSILSCVFLWFISI